MNTIEHFSALSARDLRLELEEFYADYVACLDEDRLEAWPDLFTDICLYKILPRENFDRGLPLATWLCESKGMLQDRVVAIRQTSMYAPRYVRHFVSGIRIGGWQDGVLAVQANYLVLETVADELTRVFNAGRYHDKLVVDDERLKLKEKLCVFDSILVPNSMIYPL